LPRIIGYPHRARLAVALECDLAFSVATDEAATLVAA
jgi:hypothetical protein